MKKLFTLLVVIFTSISYSQSWKYKTVKSNFDRSYNKSALTPLKRTINQLNKRQDYSLRLDSSLEFSPSDYSKTTREFNSDGNWLRYISSYWNANTESFVPHYKTQHYYDGLGNRILREFHSWDTNTNSYLLIYKDDEFYYDTNGNEILKIRYNWDTTTDSFVLYTKYESYYNRFENTKAIITYRWDTANDSYGTFYKQEYNYDTNGNEIQMIDYYWNSDSESFGINYHSYKNEKTYDSNENITLHTRYKWNTTTESFVPIDKDEFYYDTNGNEILKERYNWDIATNSYVKDTKDETTFDANGNRTLSINYNWDSNLGVYKPSFKQEYSIVLDNETNLTLEGTSFIYDANLYNWSLLEEEEFKSFWYYTKNESLSTKDINEELYSIYPNPTNDKLFIQGLLNTSKVSIYNVLGKLVLSQTITKEIDVKQLSKGIYILKIIDGQKETTRKFIKD